MFKVNEYFNGSVKSIAFKTGNLPATVGVMAKGDYEFSTSTVEEMTLISGKWSILLPGSDKWINPGKGGTFTVPKDSKFKLKIAEDSAYLCVYK
jgi:uncharacterized protein YaiE (UPF0345 family)